MKLCVTIAENGPPLAPFVLRGNYLDNIRIAADIGYEGVELQIRNPEEIEQEVIINCCLKNHIKISSVATGLGYSLDKLSLSSEDNIIREKAIVRIKSHINFASKNADCLVVIGLMKGLAKENTSHEAFEKNLIKSLTECVEYAVKKGVTLALEPINRFESDTYNTIESVLKLIRQFNVKNLKVLLDTFHMNIEESDMEQSIMAAKSNIGIVQFVDNNRMYPGRGHVDFMAIANVLKVIGYQGYIGIECLPLPSGRKAATEAYAYVHRLLLS